MKTNGFFEYVKTDVLGEIPGITFKPMFGAYSFYKDGIIFGMVVDDKLYFKVGEGNIKNFEERGMGPFIYQAKNGKRVAMKYYEVPEDIFENKSEIREWVEKSLEQVQVKVK